MNCTRRLFLQTAAALSAFRPMVGRCRYVCKSASIDVVHPHDGVLQSVPSNRPLFLATDARRKVLFAANDIADYQGLPCGSVESYAIDRGSGRLQLVSRQPLSLAATRPQSLAISPDGRSLVVAAYGGGILNVLDVGQEGQLSPVKQVVKQIGSSIHPEWQRTSHPSSVVFHPSGKFLLAADLGADRISVFRVQDGNIALASHCETVPGSGPAKLHLDSSGSRVTVWHKLIPCISRYGFDANIGHLRLRTS